MLNVSTLLAVIALLVLFGLLYAPRRVRAMAQHGEALRALPAHYGYMVALWCGIPALLFVFAWTAFESTVIDHLVISGLPESAIAGANTSLLIGEIVNVANGRLFGTPTPEIVAAAARYNRLQYLSNIALFVVGVAITIVLLVATLKTVRPSLRARQRYEGTVHVLLIACSTIAIFTTLAIIVSLFFESLRFFERVPVGEFLFGLRWEPQIAIRADQVAGSGAFGAVPVFAGTLLISVIAMTIAVPVGLMSAIYMAEYASPRFRATVKPLLEILAGVPTVVYGFFAVLTVSPLIRELGADVGLDVASNSAFAAGAVMGVMIIPFISSLSDDAINAVPNAMRDGAAALGATKSETIRQVVLPAALPGIVGAILLAVSRAIGETMIVVMAAGLIANLTANPFEGVTTVTVQIVSLLIGDTEFDNPKTLSAFALGLVLFFITLALNVVALHVTRKYREKYD
jgi:phosphate transport system permease protein